jgi:hypothetical protein
MKKLITIALIAIISITGFAQEKKERQGKNHRNSMEKFTPEQRQELMLKKMTLELDLNASQQKDMSKIIGEQASKREAFMKNRKAKTEKPTSDEMFAMKSKMLDEQIAMKARMKKMLTAEQFSKWEKMKRHHDQGMQNHYSKGDKKDMKKECEMKK